MLHAHVQVVISVIPLWWAVHFVNFSAWSLSSKHFFERESLVIFVVCKVGELTTQKLPDYRLADEGLPIESFEELQLHFIDVFYLFNSAKLGVERIGRVEVII